MWNDYSLTWPDAIRVVISAIVLYALILGLIRLMGQRTMAQLSSFDLAAAVALGAVVGRAILGYTPTLVAGAIGLLTLLSLQAGTGLLRRFRGAATLVNNRAIVLMAGPELVEENLRRTHVASGEVFARLRLAGIRSRQEIACVVLESTGQISVMKDDAPLDRELLEGVAGVELIPSSYFRD